MNKKLNKRISYKDNNNIKHLYKHLNNCHPMPKNKLSNRAAIINYKIIIKKILMIIIIIIIINIINNNNNKFNYNKLIHLFTLKSLKMLYLNKYQSSHLKISYRNNQFWNENKIKMLSVIIKFNILQLLKDIVR